MSKSNHAGAENPYLAKVKVGDIVTRYIGGIIPMRLKVTEVSDDTIVCGPYTFDRKTGGEIDKDLGWSDTETGSIIVVGDKTPEPYQPYPYDNYR